MPQYPTTPPAPDFARPPQEDDVRGLQDRMMQVSHFATIGEMAAGVAHELNQPLTAISNYAHACERMLRNAPGDCSEVAGALIEITREADRAAGIIRRLRDLVRGQPTERALADLNDVVSEMRELILSNSRVQDVNIVFELGASLAPVVVDRVQLQHVLLNLVRNALEAFRGASVPRREVVIRTATSGPGEVELSVTDTGPGVAPQVVDRLFTPFVTTKKNGTGLGLVSSQTIIRAHDGTVGYRPVPGDGACFYIRLPVRTG
jgi:C4-dicarboxylate-specific signal transduction histidine kinase